MTYPTFKEWFNNQYDDQEKTEIAEHGCVSGCAGGLIYYSETTAIYDQYAEELHALIDDFCMDAGIELPRVITESLGSLTNFKNNMVWLSAEILAQEFVNIQELA